MLKDIDKPIIQGFILSKFNKNFLESGFQYRNNGKIEDEKIFTQKFKNVSMNKTKINGPKKIKEGNLYTVKAEFNENNIKGIIEFNIIISHGGFIKQLHLIKVNVYQNQKGGNGFSVLVDAPPIGGKPQIMGYLSSNRPFFNI